MQNDQGRFFSNTNLFFSRELPSAFSGTAFHPGKNRNAGIWRIRCKNYGLTRIWPKSGLTHGRLAGNASFLPAFDAPVTLTSASSESALGRAARGPVV